MPAPSWRLPVAAMIQRHLQSEACEKGNPVGVILRRRWPRWPGFGRRRRLASALDRLDREEAKLESLADEIERRFVAIGATLHEQARLSASLVRQGDRLMELTADSAESRNILNQTIEAIAATLRFLGECSRHMGGMVGRLERYDQQMEQVKRGEEELARLLLPLRTIQTLFRIEAASLPPEMQSVFSSVTLEIARLDSQFAEIARRQAERLQANRVHVAATTLRLREQAARHGALAEAKCAHVEERLRTLEQEIARARQRNERLAGLIRDIDRESDAIAVSLQYQDITRQQMEHVLSALRDMQAGFRSRDRGGRMAVQRRATETCRLEARQLQGVDEELGRAASAIASGVDAIARCLEQIEGECLSAGDSERVAAAIETTVQLLTETGRDVRSLLAASLATLEEAVKAIHAFGGFTDDMASAMARLAVDIRLIGLNAQVQAAQVSRPGLEVLAGLTHNVSDATGTFTRKLSAGLGTVSEHLEQLVEQARGLEQETSRQRQFLDESGERMEKRLEHYQADATAVFTDVAAMLGQIRTHAGSMRAAAEMDGLPRGAIDSMRELLDEIGGLCRQPEANPTQAGESTVVMEDLKRRYTMESERAIHERLLAEEAAARGAPPAAMSPRHPAGDPADCPPAAVESAEVAAVEPGQPAAAPDRRDPSAARPAMVAAAEVHPDLGDNVELF